MNVNLILQPGAARNRSMLLYGQRLAANAPKNQTWDVKELPGPSGRLGYRLAEIVVPPMVLPFLSGDVVHVVDHAHAGYVRYTRQPAVVTVHDLIPLRWMLGEYTTSEKMSAKAGLWFRWNIQALKQAAMLVCPSRATADVLKRLLQLDAVVVHNGIDDIFYREPDQAVEQSVQARLRPLSGPFLLQVSSGFFYKNEETFLDVFLNARKQHPDLGWVRLGSPLPVWQREQLRGEGCLEAVVDYGSASVEEIAAVYRLAACLLFPSWDEGFGWPPLEAMAAGCPVVASTAGALIETACPAALSAAPDDVPGLTAAVTEIVSDSSTAADLRSRGLQHAGNFTWQRAATQLSEIYRDVA